MWQYAWTLCTVICMCVHIWNCANEANSVETEKKLTLNIHQTMMNYYNIDRFSFCFHQRINGSLNFVSPWCHLVLSCIYILFCAFFISLDWELLNFLSLRHCSSHLDSVVQGNISSFSMMVWLGWYRPTSCDQCSALFSFYLTLNQPSFFLFLSFYLFSVLQT